MSGSHDIQDTLEKYFHLTDFRPNQSEIIQAIISGRDVLAVMATGGGKSLCYQLPAVMLSGMTVVISPLISLMKDQVDSLAAQGVHVAMLNSSVSYTRRKEIEAEICAGQIRILYVSPERAVLPDFVRLLKKTEVSLFAVDEAHCISTWGHQFRPEYRQIKTLRAEFPHIPFAAFTATATERVRSDIVSELKMQDPAVFIGSFDRPNLHYAVCQESRKEMRIERIARFVREHADVSGIIYCFSRADTEKIAAYLAKYHLVALPYHAGLSPRDRAKIQELFINDEVRIICATIAFGMGIDKPDVRYVVHAHLPKDLESYYQETGRAGRDGLPSECLLFYSPGDRAKLLHMIDTETTPGSSALAQGKRERLDILYSYCTSTRCRRQIVLQYFGQSCAPCGNCDICDHKKPASAQSVRHLVIPKTLRTDIISAVGEMEGVFTVQEFISFLMGAERAKTLTGNLRMHPCFGIAHMYLRADIQRFIEDMIRDGLLVLQGKSVHRLYSGSVPVFNSGK